MQERSEGSISPVAAFENCVSIAALSPGLLMARGLWRQLGFRGHDHFDHHSWQLHSNHLSLTIDQLSPSKLTNVSRCPIKVSWNATLTVPPVVPFCPFECPLILIGLF